MGDNMVLTDGTRSVELCQIGGSTHHDGLVMAYLRKEKLLIAAEVFTPRPTPPKTPDPFAVQFESQRTPLEYRCGQDFAASWRDRAVRGSHERDRQRPGGKSAGKVTSSRHASHGRGA
jgi:hypothetical protein